MLSALQVATPPAIEPVTVAMAKLHTRIDHDADDTLVEVYIAAARAWAENYLARVLITQDLLWTVSQEPPPGGWPLIGVPVTLLVPPLWFSPDLLWRRPFTLPRQPVQSVQSVTLGRPGAADQVLDPARYGLSLPNGQLQLFGAAGFTPQGSLSVAFRAGYGDTADAVPKPIVQAILLMTAFLYERRGDDEGTAPPAAEMLLTPYRLVTFGG